MNKSKQDHIYFFWSASIIICMLLALFALMFTSCSRSNGAPEVSPSVDAIEPSGSNSDELPTDSEQTGSADGDAPADTPVPGIISTNSPSDTAVLGETEDMGQEYIDKFVFLGDSTTNGLAAYGIVDEKQVWTPENGTLTLNRWSIDAIRYRDDGTQLSIVDAVTKKQPEYMLITLGVNGVSFMDEEYFTSEYTNLVNAIKEASPNTKIILNAIYPVAKSYKYIKDISNEKIDAANTWIEKIAENTGVKFLNSTCLLKDGDGALVEGYDNGDGIHLNADSYKMVIDYVRTHGYT